MRDKIFEQYEEVISLDIEGGQIIIQKSSVP
jgi:hypothetical protein